MSRLYKVLNKQDCAELGVTYRTTERIVLAEHNIGHYTITRYPSTWGKILVLALCPLFMLWHVGRGVVTGARECVCAIHDTFQMVDRRDIWGDHDYINYLKENY